MTTVVAALSLSLAVMVTLSTRRRPLQRLTVVPGGFAEPHAPPSAPRSQGQLAMTAAVVGAIAVFVGVGVPPPAVTVVGVGALVGPRVRHRWQRDRDRARCAVAATEVTVALSGELRAGRTPEQALAAVAVVAGPLRGALEAAAIAVAVGGDAGGELRRAADRPGAERLRYVAAAWAVSESSGGRVAVVLDRLSEAMDDDDELHGQLEAAMAGPRATMVMLAGLPVLGLGLGQAVGAHPLQLLLHRPVGWALLLGAVLLDTIGVLATRAIARAALRG